MENKKLPLAIRKVEEKLNDEVVKVTPGQPDGFVQVGPEKWFLPTSYTDFADTIYNFKARADEVFICTFPRSGTAWTQEMTWLICNDFDYETALKRTLKQRVPHFELHITTSEKFMQMLAKKFDNIETARQMMGPKYEEFEAQTTRRFIKTHLPFQLLPRNLLEVGAKVIYVARNPKDVAVSYYHLHKSATIYGYTGDFESFVPFFMDGLTLWGPYWNHVLEHYKYRNHRNVHFMFYEDLKLDLETSLKKLAAFLEKPLPDSELPKLLEHLQFENVLRNPSINFSLKSSVPTKKVIIRRGEIGGNPEMTQELSEKFDEWTKKNLEGSDLTFRC